MEKTLKTKHPRHSSDNTPSPSGKFKERDVMTAPTCDGALTLAQLFAAWPQSFLEIRKHLTHRHVQLLRLTCKVIRNLTFTSFPCLMTMKSSKENLFNFLTKMASPLPFPGELRLQIIAANEKELGQQLSILKNNKALQTYAPQKRIEGIKLLQNIKHLKAEELPASLKEFECKGISRGASFNLDHCNQLLKINMDGYLERTIKVPSSVTNFECEGLYECCEFSSSSNLKVFKTKHIWISSLQIPPSITHLECDYCNEFIDFSSYPYLTSIKTHSLDPKKMSVLPPNIQTLEFTDIGAINANIIIDWASYSSLTTIRGTFIEGYFQPKSNITHFECNRIKAFGTIDLSLCPNLKEVKIERSIKVKLLLPPSIEVFECGHIKFNASTIDLSHCHKLKKLKVDTTDGGLILSRQYHSSLETMLPANAKINWA